jgi:ribosome-associated protein
VLDELRVDGGVVIPGADLSWTAVRSSGPGGQNVNKVASKVELRFDLANSSALRPDTKARLRALAGKRVDASGQLHVVSQRTRDQARNLDDAREKLAAMIAAAMVVPRTRRPTKPTRGSQRRRIDEKRRDSGKKQLRKRVTGED